MVDGRVIDSIHAHQIHHPQWITYTPVVTATAGTITTYSSVGNYLLITPKLVMVQISITMTDNGTGSGTLQATLPLAYDANNVLNTLTGYETTNNIPAIGQFVSNNLINVKLYTATTSGNSVSIVLGQHVTVDTVTGVGATDGNWSAAIDPGSIMISNTLYAGTTGNIINLSGFYAVT